MNVKNEEKKISHEESNNFQYEENLVIALQAIS